LLLRRARKKAAYLLKLRRIRNYVCELISLFDSQRCSGLYSECHADPLIATSYALGQAICFPTMNIESCGETIWKRATQHLANENEEIQVITEGVFE